MPKPTKVIALPDAAGPLVAEVPEPGDAAQPLRRFLVRLRYGGEDVVMAVDAADAWEKFKAPRGILKSDHAPEITEATDA